MFAGASALAQDYQLHTVYMYSFMRYIQWPDNEVSEPFTIGVIGETPLLESLEKLAETKKNGRRDIVVKQFKSVQEMTDCKMLFVPKEASNKLPEILTKVGKKSILVMTEAEGKGVEGSNINFVYRNGKLAFELNRSAMERGNLKVSTELARLAILI